MFSTILKINLRIWDNFLIVSCYAVILDERKMLLFCKECKSISRKTDVEALAVQTLFNPLPDDKF